MTALLTLPPSSCTQCRLIASHCACDPSDTAAISATPKLRWALLLHENENQRATATGRLALNHINGGSAYVWHRQAPPAALISQINRSDIQAWLLFPADRENLLAKATALIDIVTAAHGDNQHPIQALGNYSGTTRIKKTPLIIVPDGTWKEVRKIVRKSTWLDQVPILSLNPDEPSTYTLRRNPDPDHLCTLEIIAHVLGHLGQTDEQIRLLGLLQRFQEHYLAYKSGHAARTLK